MSVLKTIKGALNNVQQVGTSINKSINKKNKKSRPINAGIEGVDIDAGADLLNKFHEQWSDMHQQAEQNARNAQKIDNTLRAQHLHCERQLEGMNQLMVLSSDLPHLLKDITKLVDQIGALQDQCQQVEDGLVTLTDANEAAEMAVNKRHHHHQLVIYKERKDFDLERIKLSLAQEHNTKVAGHEAKLQEHLRVKQEAFEEAFAREMQNYRESGNTKMKPTLSKLPQDVELGDISIEQDNSALDAFLDSDEAISTSSTGIVTIEEDEDGDEESYVNVGIIAQDISDPELDYSQAHSQREGDVDSPDIDDNNDELQNDTAGSEDGQLEENDITDTQQTSVTKFEQCKKVQSDEKVEEKDKEQDPP